MDDFHFIAGLAAGSAWDGVFGSRSVVCLSQSLSLACCSSPVGTTLSRPSWSCLFHPFPISIFGLAGKPCLTRELSQAVDYELVGGGQVPAWHPQAFGEWRWSACSQGGCGGHCVLQHGVPGCLGAVSWCCLQNVNVSLPGSFSPDLCVNSSPPYMLST